MIKVVLLDIDNTLLDFSECAKFAMKRAFEKNNIIYKDEYFNTFTKINYALWRRIEKGTLDKDGLYKIRWKNIFAELNINSDGELFEMDFVSALFDSYHTVDGAHEILDYLKHKYILCAATNGPHNEQYSRLTNANIISYFDHIFISEDIGYSKPHEKFFDYCISCLDNVQKDEIIMVGDSLTADIYGGINYGIKTCFFNYPYRTVKLKLNPDFTILSLSELKTIL